MRFLVFLGILLFNFQCFSYSIFTLKPVNWSRVKTVDVFIAGYGEEMGLQFLYGAITRAQVHDDLYPDTRAQVILWAEEWNKRKDKEVLTSRGMTILEINSRKLRSSVIEDYIMQLPSVSSLHIVSHNAAFQGSAIQKTTDRLGHDNFPWEKIRSKFTKDSYVFLHGCNTGFLVAPGISKRLRKPVFGSMTSTDFQEIFANGQWYHNNAQFDQFPTGMAKLQRSGELYNQSFSCWKGYCHRMMPNVHPYRGHWGMYEVGLPYYQAFCNYGEGVAIDCKAGIAQGIYSTATIGPKSWEDKVIDFMCPRMGDSSVFENCIAALKGESSKKVFWGQTISCTRQKCSFKLESGRNEDNDRIQNFVGSDAGNAQLVKDFNFFMSLKP